MPTKEKSEELKKSPIKHKDNTVKELLTWNLFICWSSKEQSI